MKVDDLLVYQKTFRLAVNINRMTLTFPKFELYELGSQLRRSSNSVAANLAEGFDNKHTNIYLECISRSKGEARETIHHLKMAFEKQYIDAICLNSLINEYSESLLMLFSLERALWQKHKK